MTAIDVESIAHLDFDFIPSCEGIIEDWTSQGRGLQEFTCDNPAKLYGIRGCCGHVDTFCLDCHNEFVRDAYIFCCRFCEQELPHPVFSQVHFI